MEPFVVYGNTGGYEGWYDWPVAAFTNRRRAETWAKRANAWALQNGLGRTRASIAWETRNDAPENPYDPNMHVNYNGVQYQVRQVRHVPLDPPLPQ